MTAQTTAIKDSATRGGCLPTNLAALYVAGGERPAAWMAEAFATDSACRVALEPAAGMAEAVARLRDETFDIVLVSHEPPAVDGPELAEAIRAGSGDEQAIVVLGSLCETELAPLCYEAGADGYVAIDTGTTRGLLWTISRALDFRRVMAENRRLQGAEVHRRDREQEEAQRILTQQRQLIGEGAANLPRQLVEGYRELLRTYVIMGSGSLSDELARFVERHLVAGFGAQDAMRLHLQVLEEMILGLGNRSARHVMNRADLLVMEMMISLSDGHRRRLRDYLNPPRQQFLPGFAADVAAVAYPRQAG